MANFDPDKSANDEETKKKAIADLEKKRKEKAEKEAALKEISFGEKIGGGASSAVKAKREAQRKALAGEF